MPTTKNVLSTIALSALAIWLVDRWIKCRRASAQIGGLPGLRLLFGLGSQIGHMLPQIPYIAPSSNYAWSSKYKMFERAGAGVYGMVSVFPPEAGLCVSDVEALKQIASGRSAFRKRFEDYALLRIFGSNLLVAEGEEWKRQRRICAPAFSDRNNHLVWATAMGFMNDVIESWAPGEVIRIHDVCEEFILPVALCVIAKAGFGQDVHWTDAAPPKAGHRLTFLYSLKVFYENIFLPLIMPNWAWGLRKHWRHVKLVNDELGIHIREMIQSRRESQDHDTQRHDLFSQLVNARDGNETLSEDELVGNVMIFLVAGHETTGHTLAILLGLLALYPGEQEQAAQEIKNLRNGEGDLTYDDMRRLPYALAVMYETLRLYPMVTILIRDAVADTHLTFGHATDQTQVRHVPASSRAFIFMSGVHYNPSYWDDPEEFVPARFMDTNWNRDAFIPFSLGPRACIGRRFAETTVVAVLAKLLSKYSITIDESRFKSIPGESMLDRRQRFLNPTMKLALTPVPLPLVFTPRA
ncbi:cytochrome P450 [Ceratobasidium sp. AG-I]|nr:cytochrome P450 [Ceratobasidium sp. AG-I]